MKLSTFLFSLAALAIGRPASGVYETTCTATCTGITNKWLNNPWQTNGVRTTGKDFTVKFKIYFV